MYIYMILEHREIWCFLFVGVVCTLYICCKQMLIYTWVCRLKIICLVERYVFKKLYAYVVRVYYIILCFVIFILYYNIPPPCTDVCVQYLIKIFFCKNCKKIFIQTSLTLPIISSLYFI